MSKGRGRRQAIPMASSRNLSPIREMSAIVPVHMVPKGSKIMKGTAGHAPILVQALPPEVKEVKSKMKPSERRYTDVDQVVSDYLHYAKYGQVAPVLPGSGVGGVAGGAGLRCACCVDRNRENTMKRLALQHGTDPGNLGNMTLPKDLPEHHQGQPSTETGQPSGRPQPAPRQVPQHAAMPWGFYQPTPYAGTFLNPEFNRPFVMQTAIEDSNKLSSEEHFIYDKVLNADSQYENSMKKLQAHYTSKFEVPGDSIIVDRDGENPYN